MNSDRLGQLISHECEWQLRDLAAYIGSLLRSAAPTTTATRCAPRSSARR